MRFSRKTRDVLASHVAPEDAAVFLDAHPVPPPTAVAGGRAAHAHGESLEDWLRTQHEAARARGLLAGCAMSVRRRSLMWKKAGARETAVGASWWSSPASAPRTTRASSQAGARSPSKRSLARVVCGARKCPITRAADLGACAEGGGLAVLVARLDGAVHAIPWRDVPWGSPRGGRPSIGAGTRRWRRGASTRGAFCTRWTRGGASSCRR